MVSTLMEPGSVTLTVLEWLLTYAIHSTVLIATVWLVTTLAARNLSHRTVDVLWKTALVGGVLTTTLQQGLELSPLGGRWALPGTAAAPAPEAVVRDAEDIGSVERIVVTHGAGHVAVWIREGQGVATAPLPAPPTAAPTPARWPAFALVLFALGAVIAVTRLGLVARRLRQQLGGRRDVLEDPLLEVFLALCQRAGLKRRVRLTASSGLRSPVTLWPREVCIPERVVTALPREQQEGMLAHELAHVIRRDPTWLIVAAIVEAVFFFQPLNRLARRKMQEAAEYLADEWAVRHTGSRVHLAKCLAEVAGWLDEGTAAGVVAPMAGPRSPVRRRIARILEERARTVHEHPSGRISLTLGLLACVAWMAPGVSTAAGPREGPSAPDSDHSSAVTSHLVMPLRERSCVRVPCCGEPRIWCSRSTKGVLDRMPPSASAVIDLREVRQQAREARRRMEEAERQMTDLRARVSEVRRRAIERQRRLRNRLRREQLEALRRFRRHLPEPTPRDGRDRERPPEAPEIIGV